MPWKLILFSVFCFLKYMLLICFLVLRTKSSYLYNSFACPACTTKCHILPYFHLYSFLGLKYLSFSISPFLHLCSPFYNRILWISPPRQCTRWACGAGGVKNRAIPDNNLRPLTFKIKFGGSNAR